MDRKIIDKILNKVALPIEDPEFYPQVFDELNLYKNRINLNSHSKPNSNSQPDSNTKPDSNSKQNSKPDLNENLSQKIDPSTTHNLYTLSRQADESSLQESCSIRNIFKTRELAFQLIDDNGDINSQLIPEIIKQQKYSLAPNYQNDAIRIQHLINVLTLLYENKALARQLKSINKPHFHPVAEQIIRETLDLPPKALITDADARRATLAAWMCTLRQNVGSCFATAPAIMIQAEQPELFLKDIQELLSTGQLKRTFGGTEYAVPLSYSWGAGDLNRVYIFEKNDSFEDHKIWLAPGMVSALKVIGLTPPFQEIIIETLKSWPTQKSWFSVSVEEILRRILLNHLQLTDEAIREYELRPKEMIFGGLLMQKSRAGTSENSYHTFIEKFDEMKSQFKSVADNALLKSWEFTLASFSETKAQFSKWNLYISLGLAPRDEGGIGPRLYQILKEKLDQCNAKVRDLQEEYEQIHTFLEFQQARIRSASSEKEAQWLKSEYESRLNQFRSLETMRNQWHYKAQRYANLYEDLIDTYLELFPKYFQEIYDADIHEVAAGPYDDSPAGFRLIYKHGRTNTSQWTRVKNHTEYVQALVDFFNVTESDISHMPEFKGLEDDLVAIVTDIVSHIKSTQFLESAFYRMAAHHNVPMIKNPLENLDKVEKKPWVYTSGGSMSTLVSCYYRLQERPHEVERWVESPIELLTFLVDTIKEMGVKVRLPFEKGNKNNKLLNLENGVERNKRQQDLLRSAPSSGLNQSLLMHSPTHAFLLKPGYPGYRELCQNDQFTYTMVRDEIVLPMQRFCEGLYLDEDKMMFVIESLQKNVPKNFRHYFKHCFDRLGGSMQVSDFRQFILQTIESTQGLQYAGRGVLSASEIDSQLFSLLPLFPSYQLVDRVGIILSHLTGISVQQKDDAVSLVEDIYRRTGAPLTVSAIHLQNIVKSVIALAMGATETFVDYSLEIAQAAQKEGYAMPAPLLFADTNWVKDYFAFVVNPGTNKLELWRVDYTGTIGAPMADWKRWVDGSRKSPTWGVFNRPNEYVY